MGLSASSNRDCLFRHARFVLPAVFASIQFAPITSQVIMPFRAAHAYVHDTMNASGTPRAKDATGR